MLSIVLAMDQSSQVLDEFKPDVAIEESQAKNLIDFISAEEATNDPKMLGKNIQLKSEEIFGAILCLLFFLNFLYGSYRNRKIAKAWAIHCHSVFSGDFSYAGPGSEEMKVDHSFPLYKDSGNLYLYYASGRKGCNSLSMSLELKPRHNLFSYVLSMFGSNVRDMITLEVAMNENEMDSFVFAVVQKEELHSATEALKLKDLTSARFIKGLPQSLVCLSDHAEVSNAAFTESTKRTIAACENLIQLIYFTDKNVDDVPGHAKPPKKVLRFVFNFPESSEKAIAKLKPLMELTLLFVDIFSTFKLSSQAKALAEKRRNEIIRTKITKEHEENMKRMRELKNEKLKRQKEDIEKLSDEQRMKIEEKEKKRQQKKLMQTKVKRV